MPVEAVENFIRQNQDKINQDQVENNFDFHNHEEKEKEHTNKNEGAEFSCTHDR